MIYQLPVRMNFNPRSPYGERLYLPHGPDAHLLFQSTLPLRGATWDCSGVSPAGCISIHAPPTGSDRLRFEQSRFLLDFNPRSPYGERPALLDALSSLWPFQSTLPLRGATWTQTCTRRLSTYFNPRSPYGERRTARDGINDITTFQSTLPLRGATSASRHRGPQSRISIHAPPTGSDGERPGPLHKSTYFNPRSPYGERPGGGPAHDRGAVISIHAPPTGSDLHRLRTSMGHRNFNPRSPYGERPFPKRRSQPILRFQSTLPLRGATRIPDSLRWHHLFQSTLPLRGATGISDSFHIHIVFQSTLPLRGATRAAAADRLDLCISIHAPPTGSDDPVGGRAPGLPDFNPRSPYGERLARLTIMPNKFPFQSTLPLRGATAASCLPVDPAGHFNPRSPYGERQQKQPKNIAIFVELNDLREYHLSFSLLNRSTSSFSCGSAKKCGAKSPPFLVCLHFASK